jgi:hypothetical protein
MLTGAVCSEYIYAKFGPYIYILDYDDITLTGKGNLISGLGFLMY